MDDLIIQSGETPEAAPYPLSELALGNIVRLKKPYPEHGHRGKRRYQWGIIVEHLQRNAWGVPKVSLHLYDGRGRMMMGPNGVPVYADFVVSKLILWHVATVMYYAVVGEGKGHDLYPTCPKCKNRNQHPFAEKHCDACGGWGHVREMRRLPEVAN